MSIYTKENGTKGLFRGYLATVVGVVPYAGTSFFINETLKQKYRGKYTAQRLLIKYCSRMTSIRKLNKHSLSQNLVGMISRLCLAVKL